MLTPSVSQPSSRKYAYSRAAVPGRGSPTTHRAENGSPCRRSAAIPRSIRAYAGRPARDTRSAFRSSGPSTLTLTRTPWAVKNPHQASSISVALVCTWCSTSGANGAISAARCSRPAASGSPPCQTTEKRPAAAQTFASAATASATATGIFRSAARRGR